MSMWQAWTVPGCIAVLRGCTVGPTYRPPIASVPTTWIAAQEDQEHALIRYETDI